MIEYTEGGIPMDLSIHKNYRGQDSLRRSFNALAGEIFDGLDFENWYQNDFWGDRYNPHSIIDNGEVIANVSVNMMDFLWNGQLRHLIQLGTVMTRKSFRHQGLIRQIMNEIDRQYGQTADGIYLFANDSVLDFYPKFGFRKAREYCYTKPFYTSRECTLIRVPMREKADWKKLENAMHGSVSYSRLNMIENDSLIMFYITGFMQDSVYYDPEHDAYVIAEFDADTLIVHNVFSGKKYPLDDILAGFGAGVRQIALGFTPIDEKTYRIAPFKEEDCTLFVKGPVFDGFETDRLIFPTLSHA